VISGTEYLKAGFNLDPKNMWRRNLPVLIAFFVAFEIAQILALEYYPVSSVLFK
jgi:hypothetical protein